MRAFVLLVLLLMALPLALPASPVTIRYVGAAPGVDEPRGVGCVGPADTTVAALQNVAVGGACQVQLDARAWQVVVDDAELGHVTFRWWLRNGGTHATCLAGTSQDSVTLQVPPGCDVLDVILNAPATTGTISAFPLN